MQLRGQLSQRLRKNSVRGFLEDLDSMSFRMTNWAYTHSLKTGPKLLLVTIADKAHDDGTTPAGLEYLSYETDIPLSTLKRYMRQLREMDLLHTERREYKGFGGRLTNLIVLHPWVEGTKLSWYDYQKLRAQAAVTEREFGTEVPVENSESTQGINLIPSSNSREDAQSINLIPSAYKVSNEATQGINSDISEGGTLKERARGFNHQLINHQSVSQSVKSPGSVENSGPTDGLAKPENSNPSHQVPVPEIPEPAIPIDRGHSVTPLVQPYMQVPSASVVGVPAPVQHNPQRQGQPAPASVGGTAAAVAARGDAGPMVQGVALRQLAEDLVSDGVPAPAVKAVVQVQGLSRMVEVAMSRSQQVRSPQRYCRAVLAREWEQLVSQCAPAAYPLCARHRVRLSPAGQCRECVQESREAAEEASHSRGVNMRQVRQLAQERGLNLENIRNLELGPVVEGLICDGIVAAEAEQVACFLADNPEIVSNLEQKRTA